MRLHHVQLLTPAGGEDVARGFYAGVLGMTEVEKPPELKKRGGSDDEVVNRLHTVKREVTSAISKSHGVRVADLVLVPPGSLPITTSGKVRRSACAERYRQDDFTRLDTSA